MAALVPLTDAITRRGRRHEVEPVEAGMGRLAREHIHKITVLKRRRQWRESIVNAHAMAVITHFRVNAIGKIHGRRSLAQTQHVAFRSEDEHLFIEEIFLNRSEVVVVVVSSPLLLPINKLPQPVEAFCVSTSGW